MFGGLFRSVGRGGYREKNLFGARGGVGGSGGAGGGGKGRGGDGGAGMADAATSSGRRPRSAAFMRAICPGVNSCMQLSTA